MRLPGAEVAAGLVLIQRCRAANPAVLILAVIEDDPLLAIAVLAADVDGLATISLNATTLGGRIQRLLRRNPGLTPAGSGGQERGGFFFADAKVRDDLVVEFRDGIEEPIRPKQHAMLRLFAGNPGRLISKEEIGAAVWGYEVPNGGNSIDQYLSALRRMFRRHGHDLDRWISSVPKAGWRVGVSAPRGDAIRPAQEAPHHPSLRKGAAGRPAPSYKLASA